MTGKQGSSLFERQMAIYATYHRDPRNRATHFIGIPAIILAILTPLALGRFSLSGAEISWAAVAAVMTFAVWLALDRTIGAATALFLLPALLIAEWISASFTAATAWWFFAGLFAGGWVFQFWGHMFEGPPPGAREQPLFQALIGPMFLIAEIFFALGWRRNLRSRVEAIIAENYPEYA